MKESIHFSSKRPDWETPKDFFQVYKARYNLTLDVCATEKNHKLPFFYTKEEDGLSKKWSPERCWMNPPYGREISKWVSKAYGESTLGALVVALLPARTDTKWFHDYIYNGQAEIFFLRGRIKFLIDGEQKHPAPFPSMIVVWGS